MLEAALSLISANKQTKNPILNLEYCELRSLPYELFDCFWLEELIIKNVFTEFEFSDLNANNEPLRHDGHFSSFGVANEIRTLQNLKKLTIVGHPHYPNNEEFDISFLSELKNLTYLKINFNNISNIKFLKNLTALNYLDLSRTFIYEFESLLHLKNLTHLILRDNNIQYIEELESLKSLQYLDLSYNKIIDITILDKLYNLQHVFLCHNQISDITPILYFMRNGINVNFKKNAPKKEIDLYHNPITTPPFHIIEQGNGEILRYFNAGTLKPLNECKLIFVGEGGVGKTCLMKRLVYDTFDPKEPQTHGINKIAWKNIKNSKNELIKVNLWDFGGQDIQHSLHQFFFTERVVYVLVLNPRNDDKAGYWLEQIEKLGADSEVLVVYNWKDEKDLEAPYMSNFYELRKKYSKLPEPLVLSAGANIGFDIFKEKMYDAILHNEGLVHEYPEKWFNIKQKLEENVSIGANYINYDTYRDWCNEFDYKDEDNQRALLVTLDKIGSIVFFNRPILNQLQVLNPEWITTGAYAILTSQLTNKKNGHLSMNDLKEIFKEEKEIFSNQKIKIKYLESQFQFIIQLMLTYDLCQENPLVKHEYLIPSAFGDKPATNHDAHKKDSRIYRIQFDSPFEMLIIHRFIARNLSKAISRDYWQSGIFIKDTKSKTFALVETNLHSYRIDLWIKGENIKGFWEAMRRDFQEIFNIYKKFTYEEEVLFKKDNREVFLSYQEMLNSLQDGVSTITYHPATRLKNIDVLAVLDLFVDKNQILSKMENKRGININIENKPHFEQKNENKNIVNLKVDVSGLKELEEIKDILYDLSEANIKNEDWKNALIKALDEFNRLETAADLSAQKTSIGFLGRTFKRLKDIKDGVGITFLGVDIEDKFPKLLNMFNNLKSHYFNDLKDYF